MDLLFTRQDDQGLARLGSVFMLASLSWSSARAAYGTCDMKTIRQVGVIASPDGPKIVAGLIIQNSNVQISYIWIFGQLLRFSSETTTD